MCCGDRARRLGRRARRAKRVPICTARGPVCGTTSKRVPFVLRGLDRAAEDDGEIRRLLATLAHERRRHDQLEVRL